MHTENQICSSLGDTFEYVKYKSTELQSDRARQEASRAQKDTERNVRHQMALAYRANKDKVIPCMDKLCD